MPDKSPQAPRILAILVAMEERLTLIEQAVETRSAPAEQVRQGLRDILDIYNITGQTGSVVSKQHQQIQALAEAMTVFHGRLIEHDKQASAEDQEIHGLMVQLRSLARQQVGQLTDIERGIETSPQARIILSVAAEDARLLLTVAAEEAQVVVAAAKQDAAELLTADQEPT